MLDHVHGEVLELGQGKLVIAQNPEAAAYIVCDLSISLAFFLEKADKSLETTLLDELLSDGIDLQNIHQRVRVGLTRQYLGIVLSLEKIGQESIDSLDIFLILAVGDKLGKGMSCQVSLISLSKLVVNVEVGAEDADTVNLFLGVGTFLQIVDNVDSGAAVLNDAVDHC